MNQKFAVLPAELLTLERSLRSTEDHLNFLLLEAQVIFLKALSYDLTARINTKRSQTRRDKNGIDETSDLVCSQQKLEHGIFEHLFTLQFFFVCLGFLGGFL